MLDLFHYSFMIRAFIAGVVIAVTAPLIGNFLVIRRFSLVADTLSHISLAGVAIGLLIGVHPLVATTIFTIASAVAIEQIRSARKIPADAVLAMFLPGGLALSVVLIGLANGFNANLFSYLFGSITTVTPIDVWLILLLGACALIAVTILYDKLLYSSFDEECARLSGIPVRAVNLALMILTAVTVSLSMRVVGILLIGALMVIPSVTAMQVARSFRQSLAYSIAFALAAVIGGLIAAYYLNLPAGGTIVLLSLAIFGALSLLKKRP